MSRRFGAYARRSEGGGRGSSKGGAFDPTQIASLQRWWKGGVGITGNPITAWVDTKGSATLDNAVTPPPAETVNGIVVPSFDGVDDFLNDSGAAAGTYDYLHTGAGMTIAAVVRRDSASGADCWLSTGDDQTTEIGAYCGSPGTNVARFVITNGSAYVIDVSSTGTPFSTTALNVIVVTHSTADGARLYINGSADGTASNAATPSSSNASNALIVGSRTGSRQWDGAVLDLLLFNAIVSSGERGNLTSYLQTRWGL